MLSLLGLAAVAFAAESTQASEATRFAGLELDRDAQAMELDRSSVAVDGRIDFSQRVHHPQRAEFAKAWLEAHPEPVALMVGSCTATQVFLDVAIATFDNGTLWNANAPTLTAVKAKPAYWQRVIHRVGCEPGNAIVVGDHAIEDGTVPRSSGIQRWVPIDAIDLRPPERRRRPGNRLTDAAVSRLADPRTAPRRVDRVAASWLVGWGGAG